MKKKTMNQLNKKNISKYTTSIFLIYLLLICFTENKQHKQQKMNNSTFEIEKIYAL